MDLDERLIEEVRKRPRIYDLAHIDYKNLKKKDIAWKEVASNIKLDKAQCKKRWKGLRDSYKRCKRMEQMSSGSGAGTPKHIWRYSDTISFLDNVTSARRTIGSVTESPEIILPDDCNSNSDDLSFSDSKQTSISQTPMSSSCLRKFCSQENKQEKFGEFLDLAASSISYFAAFVEQRKKQDSTATHFTSLATKIREANMPINVVNQIEAKVSALVFSEIENYQQQ